MKWFKHESNARHDAKLQKLRLKYGLEGYGMYFFLLECIAGTIEKHNLTFELEEDAELISATTQIHIERVEEMMRYMVNLGLFESDGGRITCLKMALRSDDYTQKLLRDSKNVPTLSGQSTDSVGIKSELIEEKRREEKRTEQSRKTPAKFEPPTLEEVKAHFQTKGFCSDPESFFHYYDSADWVKANHEPIVYWRRAAANWESRHKDRKSTTKNMVSIDPITGREAHYTTMQPREDGSW